MDDSFIAAFGPSKSDYISVSKHFARAIPHFVYVSTHLAPLPLLNVNYILEGSGLKVGNRIKIMLQLIEAKTDKHLWSNPYQKEVSDENIFKLQEDVALSVATELKAIITPLASAV